MEAQQAEWEASTEILRLLKLGCRVAEGLLARPDQAGSLPLFRTHSEKSVLQAIRKVPGKFAGP